MDKYIIKGAGPIKDVCKMLNVLKTIYGDGVTLSDLDIKTRYNQMDQAIKNQIETEYKTK